MPALDPNWFYSSLAQSAAAIVALLGSSLIARLHAQIGAVRESRDDILEAFRSAREALTAKTSDIGDYLKWLLPATTHARETLHAGTPKMTHAAERDFMTTKTPEEHAVTPEYISDLERRTRQAEELANKLAELANLTDVAQIRPKMAELLNYSHKLPGDGGHVVAHFLFEFKPLFYKIIRHEKRAAVRGSYFVAVILAALSIAGVVLPLYELTAYSRADKIGYLLVFGIALLAIPSFIVYQLGELKDASSLALPEEDRVYLTSLQISQS